MKVSTKLYATTGVLLGVGFLLAGLGAWYLHILGNSLDEAVNRTATRSDLANAVTADTWEIAAEIRQALLFAAYKQEAQMATSYAEAVQSQKRVAEHLEQLQPLLLTENERRTLANLKSGMQEYSNLSKEQFELTKAGKLAQADDLMPRITEVVAGMAGGLAELRAGRLAHQQQLAADAARQQSESTWVSIFLSCLLVAVGIIAVFVVRGINRTLTAAIRELDEGAEQVASAASQVSASSQSLAQGSSEQAASLEETSASSEEINSMSRKNSENSRVAADLMIESQKKINQANLSLEESVAAMEEITTQSDKISKIIKTIDEIAFQTNILALNAAVEAARAGEAGMGFAVVADEVRNLAQRAAQAAKDTSVLIEESITKSNDGKVKVDQVASAIHAITEDAAKVKTLVDEVNLGSQEQTRGIEQIGKAIAQMEQVTQKSAANAEESASAAEQLNAQSEALKQVVERLSAMVGGGEAGLHEKSPRRKPLAAAKLPAVARGTNTGGGLSALRAAITKKPSATAHGTPSYAVHNSPDDAFPLEDQFKEF